MLVSEVNTVLPWIVAGAFINFEPPSEGTQDFCKQAIFPKILPR